MKAFDHAIGLRVVGGSTGSFYSKESHKVIPQLRFELSSAISHDGRWDSESGDPTTEKCMGDSFRSDGGKWNGFWPAGKTIHTGKKICVAL